MKITIRPNTSNLTATSFDEFLASVLACAKTADVLVLDLRALRFIDLFAVVGIIYCCTDIQERFARRVQIICEDDGAGTFLPRVGFFDFLSPTVEVSDTFTPARLIVEAARRGTEPTLIELTPIDTEAAIPPILSHLIKVLRHRLFYPKNDAHDLAIVFSELCHNVVDHNPSGAGGLAAMQVYGRPPQRFMQFVVADRGAGILTTLQRNPQNHDLKSDVEAISASAILGTSEFVDVTHGNGLYHLVRLAEKHSGNVHIRSGAGKVYVRSDREQEHRFTVAPLSGTQFSITFPARDRSNP